MAYIAGRKEFWSLPFAVGPGVLVPRPETETLVECALEFFSDNDAPMRILDCGTGSGCLLLAILHERPNARGIGIDRSADALAYARRNARDLKLDGRCELIQGSWSDAPSEPFDLIVSNPPYIVATAISALEPELGFEPREALAAGESGLDAYRNLAPVVRARLAPGGQIGRAV